MPFTALEDSEKKAEIRTKRRTIPAAGMANAVEALALYVILHYIFFLTDKSRVRIPSDTHSDEKLSFSDLLTGNEP